MSAEHEEECAVAVEALPLDAGPDGARRGGFEETQRHVSERAEDTASLLTFPPRRSTTSSAWSRPTPVRLV